MTPEAIQQAREHAQAALAYRPIHLKPATENEVMFARAVLALTEQQPEPDYAHPLDGDFYTQFCYGVEAEQIAADLPAAAVVEICTRIAHRVQRKFTERQSEPVSRDELAEELSTAYGRTFPETDDIAAAAIFLADDTRAAAGRRVVRGRLRMTDDIIAKIDEATGCQECGKPLGRSPSDDFCSEICQRTWHARQGDGGAVPSFRGATPDLVIMDELTAWENGTLSYGELMLRTAAAQNEDRARQRAEKERLFARLYNAAPPADLVVPIRDISIDIEVTGEAARQFGEALNGFLADTAHEHRWMPDEPDETDHECRCAVTNPPCSHCTDCTACNTEI